MSETREALDGRSEPAGPDGRGEAPGQASSRGQRLGRARLVPWLCLLVLLVYPVINPWKPYPQAVLLLGFLLAIQASSWNIISGYAGYVSLGHSMFVGLGAYAAGLLSARWGVNPLLVAPLGGVVALVVALLIGSVVLRTRGHAFVIITIAMLLAAQVLAVNWAGLTKGSDGITLALPFWSRDFQNIPFYYIFLLLLVATVLFSGWLRRTKLGAGLVAIREDEGKAAAIGIDTTRLKITAYAVSAFGIGVAGGVYAYYLTFIDPVGSFEILGSVTIVLAALAGGRGTLYGPVLGAFIINLIGQAATVYGGGTRARLLIFGAALMLVVLFLPKGILPTLEAWWRRRHPAPVEYTDQAAAVSRATRSGPGSSALGRPPDRDLGRTGSPATLGGPPDGEPGRAGRPAGPGGRPDRKAGRERQGRPVGEGGRVSEDGVVLLDVRGVTKRFGGLTAVDQADLTVRQGTITALIGPNGSGKTTLFNLVTGGLAADSGEIWFGGRRVDKLPPWRRGHLGIGRTYQVTRLFPEMTVLENVVAPLPDSRWRTLVSGAERGHEAARARELLDVVGLARLAGQRAEALSYGQQKLVELAQALMLHPRLILLDEPASGVNPSLLAGLTDVIRELNAAGITFLIVEHNIPWVLDLCRQAVVFSRGAPIAEGPPEIIREDPAVLDAYLGEVVT